MVKNYAYNLGGNRTGFMATMNSHIAGNTKNIVAEIAGSTSTTIYIRGIGLIASQSGGASLFYGFNAHGDVVQLTDTSGAVVRTYGYDAFGVEKDPDEGDSNPFRYCGEYLDAETGTYYLRARYYHPVTGRFLSEDPIRNGLNFYTYCASNPIIFIDPWGLEEVAARAYAEARGATVVWLGNVTIGGIACAKANVTYRGETLSITGRLVNGTMMVDDSVINDFIDKTIWNTDPFLIALSSVGISWRSPSEIIAQSSDYEELLGISYTLSYRVSYTAPGTSPYTIANDSLLVKFGDFTARMDNNYNITLRQELVDSDEWAFYIGYRASALWMTEYYHSAAVYSPAGSGFAVTFEFNWKIENWRLPVASIAVSATAALLAAGPIGWAVLGGLAPALS